MSFSSAPKLLRLGDLHEAIVSRDLEPSFFGVTPHTAAFFREIFQRSHFLDEWRGDSAQERGSSGEHQLDGSPPHRPWGTTFIPPVRARFFQESCRMIFGADPTIIVLQKPNPNLLATLYDSGLIFKMNSVAGDGCFQRLEYIS